MICRDVVLEAKGIKQTLLIATLLTIISKRSVIALQDQTLRANEDSMINGVFQQNRSEA